MNFVVRPFQGRDAPELWNLHVVTVLAAGFSREVVEWDTDLHSIPEHYAAKGGYFVVARDDGQRLIGMGGYVPSSPTSVELRRMRVHPDVQQAGVGKAILRVLELEAARSGFSRAHLDTANAKAQPFYARNGYQFLRSESEGGFEFYFFEKALRPVK